MFDEYQSKENAKHVLRAMKENARQGYWNGSRPPFGYRVIEVDRRGARIKKKLAIESMESSAVQLIFKLFMEGDGRSGPMGVKAVAGWLNQRGYRTRAGATWGIGPIHALLTHPVYAGRMRFNRTEALRAAQGRVRTRVCRSSRHYRAGGVEQVASRPKGSQPALPPRIVMVQSFSLGLALAQASGRR
jgi:hypothetical protein